jgi:hypothetical protein
MEDFPAEVKEVLSADPTLAKEIEYDLRRHQEQERLRQVGFISVADPDPGDPVSFDPWIRDGKNFASLVKIFSLKCLNSCQLGTCSKMK